MARRKTRSCHAHSCWFLLKDLAILIVIVLLNQMHLENISPVQCGLINSTSTTSPASDDILIPWQDNKNSIINNKNSSIKIAENVISEKVVIPGSDPEREAQLLYEKSLKEISSTFIDDETIFHQTCESWVKRGCQCKEDSKSIVLTCKGISLTNIPKDLPFKTTNLDVGNNNITSIAAKSFILVPNLEELTISDNIVSEIDVDAFEGIGNLKHLALQNCGLKTIPGESFHVFKKLISLQLNGNALSNMDSNGFKYLRNLRTLRLEGNLFHRIPTNALIGLKSLEALTLGNNLLTIISDTDFPKLYNLKILLLKRNQLMKISQKAFSNLTNLKVLELNDNFISTLPEGLSELTHLQELYASRNRIKWINDTSLPKSLHIIELRANPLNGLKTQALKGMSKLRKLILSDVRTLTEFPSLEGCISLEILKLDRCGLKVVPPNICKNIPKIKSLELTHNMLSKIPVLTACKDLRLLDLSYNHIYSISGRPFQGIFNLNDLLMSYNKITSIPYDAFNGIAKLQLLDLEGNEISYIDEEAFKYFDRLEDLNLGNNIFAKLPTTGLQHLLHLKTFNNPKLREFPQPEVFPKVQKLVVSYAYHCCSFLPLVAMSATRKPPTVHETIIFPSYPGIDMTLWNNSKTENWPQWQNVSNKLGLWDNFGTDLQYPNNIPSYIDEYYSEDFYTVRSQNSESILNHGSIQCKPLPGPFLPCTDLFDWWTLRCGVWVVFLLALLGNGTVVFVLVFSRSKMDVPRFLVCNLAAADFFMGIYLGILAIVDASTLGEFRMYAIPWQMSVMCQFSGFLAVLSSELSVYTLAVITLERNYAITHAIHLNKRLSLKQATYIMAFGWTFALIMASLPLLGVSDYRKFAVCLPFETTTGLASLSYVIGLMFINGCAFLTLMGCYLKMYWAIRGSQAWNTNDSRIAKRMALLVFTDFLCWSPIAFFSITAIFGLQLVSLEQAKIFTVFVLPLNSCCNPFLYAIMTKQFKRDCVMLCKSFEETRVTKANGGRGHCERPIRELPPLIPASHPPGCRCLRMMPSEMPRWHKKEKKDSLWTKTMRRLGCNSKQKRARQNLETYNNYQFAEVKNNKPIRANSISSENFCSSRSSSWRNGPSTPNHKCAIQLKNIEGHHGRRRHSAWLITRKTSQDSNLSSSRNDSSASATTASTSTFRLSRSSAGSSNPIPSLNLKSSSKPRLVRQEAVQEEDDLSSPPHLGVHFLPTIPSAADSSIVMDEDSLEQITQGQYYTILHQNNVSNNINSSPNMYSLDKPP